MHRTDRTVDELRLHNKLESAHCQELPRDRKVNMRQSGWLKAVTDQTASKRPEVWGSDCAGDTH